MPPAAMLWGVTTSALIASYTVVDGIGVRAAGHEIGYIVWLFIFEVVPIGAATQGGPKQVPWQACRDAIVDLINSRFGEGE